MNKYVLLLCSLSFLSCSSPQTRTSKDWKKDSDKISKAYANSLARLDPEEFSIMGLTKFDAEVTPYSKNYDHERYVHAYKWKEKFVRFLETEKNPELRTDINILLDVAKLRMEEFELVKEAGIVPFQPLTQSVYNTLSYFFRPDAPANKIASAMARFRKYVRGEGTTLPLVDGYTAFMLSRMSYLEQNKRRGFWPSKVEIQTYLDNSEQYLAGIEKMLSTWKSDEWKRDFAEFKNQDEDFRKFLKKKVYPYARNSNVMPEKVYTFKLKTSGIYSSPRELIETASADYKKTYAAFKKLALKVGESLELDHKDPASVITFLRIKSVSNDKELMDLYGSITDEIFNIIQEKKLLTLPKRPEYKLRFASKLEAQITPSPQFLSSPWLTKTKVPAQFILPRVEDTHGMDDYNYVQSIYTLIAHEAIPGHALQFERFGESGSTIARGHFAFNNANVEGWALYSEDMILPHVPDDVKLIFYQRLLWRQARMFLDPQLNLGLIKPERVLDLYTNELGFSEGLAKSELKRYSYILPGQAPSYYYGLKIILDTKAKVKDKPDTILDEKCFNDALLNSGILPLKVINDRLVKNLNCVHH
jgi:hypothetical protein